MLVDLRCSVLFLVRSSFIPLVLCFCLWWFPEGREKNLDSSPSRLFFGRWEVCILPWANSLKFYNLGLVIFYFILQVSLCLKETAVPFILEIAVLVHMQAHFKVISSSLAGRLRDRCVCRGGGCVWRKRQAVRIHRELLTARLDIG